MEQAGESLPVRFLERGQNFEKRRLTGRPQHPCLWRVRLNPDTQTYDMLLKLVKTRMSVRKFRPDPIPGDTINKILEVARWAMSGANSQPWEFIVVTEPEIKKQLRDAYSEYNTDYIFWMEQQREYNLRHPSY